MDHGVTRLDAAAHKALWSIATRLGAASTRELAGALGRSQVEACELLIELEQEGLVEPVVWRVTAGGRAMAGFGEGR